MIWVKTDAGRAEVQRRALVSDRSLRTLLQLESLRRDVRDLQLEHHLLKKANELLKNGFRVSCPRDVASPRKPFFDSTRSTAVFARARSLRKRSRSSSLMRLRSCLVACGLARASSGSASAAVALARHLSNSAGYTPCSRHHAFLPASLIDAVVTTASSRAPAVLAPTLQRSRSNAYLSRNHSTAALSGGNILATALSLNPCPYRVTVILHRRPQVLGSIGATTILARGAGGGGIKRGASFQGVKAYDPRRGWRPTMRLRQERVLAQLFRAAPLPIPDFWHVLAVNADVLLVLDQLVLELPL